MRLKVKFGLSFTKETVWWGEVRDFPYLLSFRGVKYEFVMYNEDTSKQYDYILTFSEIQSYDPNYHATCDAWEDRFGKDEAQCECGAGYTSFPWDHMRFCRLWKHWQWV